jgi:3-deoxy-D-manno-octulosonate 8-phosphate phosphatase (KDO 8-P phosphatase)
MALEQKFVKLGGTFLTPLEQIRSSLASIKAFVFDWDGVFNDGRKSSESDGTFSEIDSMGINLLRFDYWLRNKKIPLIFIITGLKNNSAIEFSKREHFDGIFLNFKNKEEALESICNNYKIVSNEIAYVFDDVLDIAVAKLSGLSFLVGRDSNPLFTDYIKQNSICNYISAFSGGNYAVREICELITGLSGDYNQAIELRIQFKGEYEQFLSLRNAITTEIKLSEKHVY